MPNYFSLGRRKNDIGLAVDFRKKRVIVRSNTSWVQGTPLEDIPEGSNGFAPGMVLISQKWNKLYFLKERDNWTEEQYFDLANSILIREGILTP